MNQNTNFDKETNNTMQITPQQPSDVDNTSNSQAQKVKKIAKRTKTEKVVNTHQQFKSLEDASKRVSISKYLFSCDKMPLTTTSHYRLFNLVASRLLQAYDQGVLDLQQDLSMLSSFYGKIVDSSLYQGNSNLQALACKLLPSLDEHNVPIGYLKLLNSIIDIINLNILNYSIYIERKLISKYRLFDIIELVVFTQLLPTESNQAKVEFKQSLSQDILKLRKQLIEENYRGLGKSVKPSNKDTLNSSDDPGKQAALDSTQAQQLPQ